MTNGSRLLHSSWQCWFGGKWSYDIIWSSPSLNTPYHIHAWILGSLLPCDPAFVPWELRVSMYVLSFIVIFNSFLTQQRSDKLSGDLLPKMCIIPLVSQHLSKPGVQKAPAMPGIEIASLVPVPFNSGAKWSINVLRQLGGTCLKGSSTKKKRLKI